jgi:hypothetical protein
LRHPKELFIVTLMTAAMLAVVSDGVAPAVSGATASGTTNIVTAACNNTFNGTKFPLQYRIVGTPSVSPVAAGGSFTVDWNVTGIASAGFLNGVYAALGAPTEIPITVDKLTIVPMSGATGAAVQAGFGPPADPFVIPEPASTPVEDDVEIPLGTVTGSYTAGASGAILFTIDGNAWAPTDTLPAGVPESAWHGTPAVLTDSGKKSFTTASLFGGIIAPSLICMAGQWTQGGTVAAPTFGPPLLAATGFQCMPIDGAAGLCPDTPTSTTAPPGSSTTSGGSSTTSGSSTTTGSSTTSSSTTTTHATSTTSSSTTTTHPSSTTTTAHGSTTTTSPSGSTTTTSPAPPLTGTTTYHTDCVDSLVGQHNVLTYEVTATALSKVATGEKITLYDQTWTITVPETLVATLKGLLGDSFEATITVSVNGVNTDPAKWTSPPITATLTVPASGPLVSVLHPADAVFTATGGDASFTLAGASTKVSIAGNPVTLDCTPTDGTVGHSTATKFKRAAATLPPILTVTVQALVGGTTTTTSRFTTSTTATGFTTLPVSGATSTTAAAARVLGTSLPRTGASAAAIWAEILTALLLFELGLLIWAFGEWMFNRELR